MSEVMAKSKEYKVRLYLLLVPVRPSPHPGTHLKQAMRQMTKEQDEQIRHAMDSEFGSIRDLLFGQKIDPSSSGSNAVPLGVRPGRPAEVQFEDADHASSAGAGPSTLPPPNSKSAPQNDDDDDYDQVVRQLVFDKRAKPTDRTKTEEELAVEEAEKLQKQERARLRRMRGDVDESGSENDERPRKRRRGVPQADDLEDDFEVSDEEDGLLGPGLEDAVSAGESEGEDEEEEEDASSAEDSEGETGSDNSEDDDSGSEAEAEAIAPSRSAKSKGKAPQRKKGELPFTFPAPSSHEEFLEVIDGLDPSVVPTVIQRIRTIHHPSLAEDNKFKLQVCLHLYKRFLIETDFFPRDYAQYSSIMSFMSLVPPLHL